MTASIAFDLPATAHESKGASATQAAATRHDRWPWAVAAVAFVNYALIAVWLIESRNLAIGDAVSRTASARMMVSSSDPHLSAWGFYWMPIPTASRAPVVLLLEPLHLAHLGGSLTSALFLAATIPVLAATGKAVGLTTGWTATICVLFAANPVTVWSGSTGMSETTFGFFLAIALYGLVRFSSTRLVQPLLIVGFGLAGCMGCRFETLFLAPAFAVTIGLIAGRERWRAAAIIVGMPPLVVFALWTLASKLIQGDAFYWYTIASTIGVTPDDTPWLPEHITPVSVALLTVVRVGAMAPTMFLPLVALAVPHRNRATTFALVVVSWIMVAAIGAQLLQGDTWATPRYYYHVIEFGAVGVMWLMADGNPRTMRVLGYTAAAGLALSVPLGAWYLSDPLQTKVENEHVMMRSLLGMDPAPTVVGQLAAYRHVVDVLDPMLAEGDRIAIDTIDAGPFLFTTEPEQFILPENRDSQQIVAAPEGRIDLILVRGGRTTPQGQALQAIVNADPRWVEIEDFGDPGRLFRFQDDQDAPPADIGSEDGG